MCLTDQLLQTVLCTALLLPTPIAESIPPARVGRWAATLWNNSGDCVGARPPKRVLRTTRQCLRRPYVQTETYLGTKWLLGLDLNIGGKGEEGD